MAKRIITISREFGSGGRFIGEKVAKELGIAYYDKDIISQIAEKSGLSPEYIREKAELSTKKGLFAYAFTGRDITGKSVEDIVYETQSKVIMEIARSIFACSGISLFSVTTSEKKSLSIFSSFLPCSNVMPNTSLCSSAAGT